MVGCKLSCRVTQDKTNALARRSQGKVRKEREVRFLEPIDAEEIDLARLQDPSVDMEVHEVEGDIVNLASVAELLDLRQRKAAVRQELLLGFEDSRNQVDPAFGLKVQPQWYRVQE